MNARITANGDEPFDLQAIAMIAPAGGDTWSRGCLPLPRAMAAGLALAATVAAHAGDAGSCAPEAVHADTEGQSLTRAERLAHMDRAFYDSLARFDECQSAATGTGAATGAGAAAAAAGRNAAGADGGTGGDSAGTGDGASMESVAAEGIQGAEAPEAPETTADGTSVDGTSADDASIESVAAGGIRGTETPENGERTAADTDRPPAAGPGRTPEDIPAPDNDSVLEAQIRRAAMEETDPRIRAELWNEYRKYKGLPPKPLPGEEGGNDDAQTSG